MQLKIPNEIPFSIEEQTVVSQEVQNLLSKGAIVPTHNEFIPYSLCQKLMVNSGLL